jgi:hypothetical protein
MKVLVVGNFSDQRCGFQNFSVQTVTALQRTGAEVAQFDGTYPAVYKRREAGEDPFFPPEVSRYDVVHIIWHAATMNHYSGATWPPHTLLSWWDGGPTDASCPFEAAMHVKWSSYPRNGYYALGYPVPDWTDSIRPLPLADPDFTVGSSSVRGDGVEQIRAICLARGWATNFSDGGWLSVEDEIRRLARSSVNVCWYHTSPIWHDLASAPSMMLAAGRPLLINKDSLTRHLHDFRDIYVARDDNLERELVTMEDRWQRGAIIKPLRAARQLSWTIAADKLVSTWLKELLPKGSDR